MSSANNDPDASNSADGDVALNHRECPHCKLWFRLDEARPSGHGKSRCPNCGWEVQNAG